MEEGLNLKKNQFQPLIGHEASLALFERVFKNNSLAHAYLITGAKGAGKNIFALHLAALVLGGEVDLSSQPDFLLIERGLEPKTGKPRAIIALDQIHALCNKLSRKSFLGGWQVAVIRDAQLLNTAAANALLKTLEEPHSQTLILLTAPDKESVLPTIRSRCQEAKLGRVTRQEIERALVDRGIAATQASLLARLANGCPSQAWYYANDAVAFSEFCSWRGAVLSLSGTDYAARWRVVENILPKKLVFQEAGFSAQKFLSVAAELLRDVLLLRHGQPERIAHVDVIDGLRRLADSDVDLLQVSNELYLARQRIQANVNPRNVLRQFVLFF